MGARTFAVRVGVVSSVGTGLDLCMDAVLAGRTGLRELPGGLPGAGLVAGRVANEPPDDAWGPRELPRTHRLALGAAREAAGGRIPDCVIVGTTSGGIDRTEENLRDGVQDPRAYAFHGAHTVATRIADELGVVGPTFSVATACSSGAIAIAIALGLLRSGRVHTALAGGADALSRLTLHGFRLLQLVDPEGTRPLDRHRAGMSLGEAAAFLFLVAADAPPPGALAEVCGVGMSCDAYHATKPLPGGEQAANAIRRALADAGIGTERVGYINLHGTGTPDNDVAEARAIQAVFPGAVPVSSTKGATGHTLAAAGALEAALSIGALLRGQVLPSVRLREIDPSLGLEPCRQARPAALEFVLSNSFGFGGNNAALVVGRAEAGREWDAGRPRRRFSVLGTACASPAGDTESTLAALTAGPIGTGTIPDSVASGRLDPRVRRRLKRLTSLVLSLAEEVRTSATTSACSVAFGTAWGSLEDTHTFLAELFATNEKLASPTAFIGSVHNAPAAQAALGLGATGPNLTTPSGRTSFEAALLAATVTVDDADLPLLLVGADEHHPVLSPLLGAGAEPREGAAALLLGPAERGRTTLGPLIHRRRDREGRWIEALRELLPRGPEADRVVAVLVDGARPRELADLAAAFPEAQVGARSSPGGTAVDTVLVARAFAAGVLPAGVAGAEPVALEGRSVLLVTVDDWVAAVEVARDVG
ncbi:MAG: beta-ketoacyl synthase chain length factor [Polyangiaceae bacterium]|nr:beta-ketoacyl synthase chain length factor [Polyangiaceae bacterium]